MYEQLDIFDLNLPDYKIDKPIRLIELFAGIGSQAMALRDLGGDFEHYRVVEFDRFAIASYNAIHGTDFPTMDITNISGADLGIVDTDMYCYIMTYSFPCQDLSVAGKQRGMTKGSGTRSGLLWEVERLLNEVENLPKVLIMENVPQVHNHANMPDFQKWIDFLTSKGYSNYWQDLNAKDYGVAQNRSRCFMVSILGEWNYKFPQPIILEKTMKDYLEDEVDEKYYINSEKAQKLIQQLIDNGTLESQSDFEMEGNFNQRGKVHSENGICRTILGSGHAGNEPKVLKIGNINPSRNGINGNVYAGKLAPAITTNKGEGTKVCIDLSTNAPSEKMISNCITAREDRGISNQRQVGNGVIVAMRGRNPDNPSDRTAGSPTEQRLEPNSQGICNTLTSVQKDNMVLEPKFVGGIGAKWGDKQYRQGNRIYDSESVAMALTAQPIGNTGGNTYMYLIRKPEYRIRKLTPLECWRLMGFSDEDFHEAEQVNSNSQLYKQAGNSIVKPVLMAILGQMIPGKENVYKEVNENANT
uniref:Cytosine specific methyltransferase n=1 Tax=Dulem virus 39 TaxID=3145757 RepID=A0AAU8B853_9CAUD